MADDPKATLTQRLDVVIQHLRQQQQSNAPISPWVITELETIKTAVVDYEPPPLRDIPHAEGGLPREPYDWPENLPGKPDNTLPTPEPPPAKK